MKTTLSIAVSALLYSSTNAVKFEYFHGPNPVRPHDYHWNEDYHSVPDPISGVNWMTSTQAKYLANEQTDVSSEPMGINYDFFDAYNAKSSEPVMQKFYLQMALQEQESSESESESESDDQPENHMTVLWHVSPDYGELDDYVVNREKDSANGEKKSGWSNPLGWTDSGNDDDLVMMQQKAHMRFAESGFDTPADTAEGDAELLNQFVQLQDEEDGEVDEVADAQAVQALNNIQTFDNGLDDAGVLWA